MLTIYKTCHTYNKLCIYPCGYSFCRALNREFFSDTCWSLSMYLEAVAMLPQIYMFQKQASDEGGTVEVTHTGLCVVV